MSSEQNASIRILVTGGRKYTATGTIYLALEHYAHLNATVVHGGASGADALAAREARDLGFSVEPHPAYWDAHGRAAGPIRNQEMVDAGADVVLAFGGGAGTDDCVRRARKAGIPVKEFDRE